ncbi:MAG: 50S ribosomal protein L10 [Candidatus Cardinium sp.]|nr:50S ribosomal protein L10 [Candidatus Cardinium sp.]
MKRAEKLTVIEDLANKFTTYDCFYVVDAMGLTVAQVNKFRKSCAEQKLLYQVAKNTFIQKALERSGKGETHAPFFSKVLSGFSGILFVSEKASTPARMLKDFWVTEQLNRPLLKGASIYGDLFIGPAHLEALRNLKSKVELLGDIVALLQSPMANVMAALQSGERRLMGVVETLSKVSL